MGAMPQVWLVPRANQEQEAGQWEVRTGFKELVSRAPEEMVGKSRRVKFCQLPRPLIWAPVSAKSRRGRDVGLAEAS